MSQGSHACWPGVSPRCLWADRKPLKPASHLPDDGFAASPRCFRTGVGWCCLPVRLSPSCHEAGSRGYDPHPRPWPTSGLVSAKRQPRPVPEVSFPVRGLSQASTAGIGAYPQTNWLRPTAIRRSDGFPASAMRVIGGVKVDRAGGRLLTFGD